MEDLAFPGNRGGYPRKRTPTQATWTQFPSSSVSNSIPHKWHGAIQKARPNKISFFVSGDGIVFLVQYFQETVFRCEMHLAFLALLDEAAIFRHAVAVKRRCLKRGLDFFTSCRIKRFATREDDAHRHRFAAA